MSNQSQSDGYRIVEFAGTPLGSVRNFGEFHYHNHPFKLDRSPVSQGRVACLTPSKSSVTIPFMGKRSAQDAKEFRRRQNRRRRQAARITEKSRGWFCIRIPPTQRVAIVDVMSRAMVACSFVFLVLVGGLITLVAAHTLRHSGEPFDWSEISVPLTGILILWPLFALEILIEFLIREPGRHFFQKYRIRFLAVLLPPLRMGMVSRVMHRRVWMFYWGWRAPDRHLCDELENFFNIRMIFVAMLSLPVLVIEHLWRDAVLMRPWLAMTLDVCTAGIWVAFTTEFIVRVSIADRKLKYVIERWLDLAVILLPLVSFLRFLRISSLASIAQLHRVGELSRLYRLRGMGIRAFKAILMLQLIQRMIFRSPESKKQRLQRILREKRQEMTLLREEMQELRKMIREVDIYEKQKRSKRLDSDTGETQA